MTSQSQTSYGACGPVAVTGGGGAQRPLWRVKDLKYGCEQRGKPTRNKVLLTEMCIFYAWLHVQATKGTLRGGTVLKGCQRIGRRSFFAENVRASPFNEGLWIILPRFIAIDSHNTFKLLLHKNDMFNMQITLDRPSLILVSTIASFLTHLFFRYYLPLSSNCKVKLWFI